MNSLLFYLIEEAKKNNRLISLSLDGSDYETAVVGFVKDYDDLYVTLNHISSEGFEDGILVHKIDNIYSASYDDRYNKRLEFLYKNKALFKDADQVVTDTLSGNVIWNLLHKAKELEVVVTIGFDRDFTTSGYVKDLNESEVLIRCIGYEGDYDGLSVFLVDDIDSISYNDIDNRKTDFYYKNRETIYK